MAHKTGLRYTEGVKRQVKEITSPKAKVIRGKNPAKLTEDEADAIISHRRLLQKRHKLDAVMRQAGYAVER